MILPFGAFVYGFAQADSYGYPGGMSLAPVATVTQIVLAPKRATNPVGTEHCVTATVTDQNSNGVPGIRVDFAVTGANTASGFATTDAGGLARFCYTGTNAGDDTITGSVGTLSDTASKRWGGGGGTPVNVPTLSEWTFLALAVMLSVVAARSLGRGRRHSA